MSIVKKVAYITWTSKNKLVLESLGYLFTGYNEILEIAEHHGIQFGLNSKEKLYEVVMNSSNKKNLLNNGYEWIKSGQTLMVKPEDLTKGSHTKVMCLCDYCNKVIFTKFKDYFKTTSGGTKKQKCGECGNSVRKKTSVYISQLSNVHNGEIVLIDEYKGAHQTALHKHLICNYEWNPFPHDLLKGQGCPKCNGNNYVDDANNLFAICPRLKLEWDYKKNSLDPLKTRPYSNKEVWWICTVDSTHSYPMPVSKKVKEERGCPICSGRSVHLSNCLATTHPGLVEQWHPTKNTITPFDVTYGSNKTIYWLGKCGHEWPLPVKRMVSGEGCSICNESKGERYVREFLENMKMKYTYQKKFDDLKFKGHLFFDFCVHTDVGDILIEYHGDQHYKLNKFFYRTREDFKHRLKLDGIKRRYAKNRGMKYIVIPYKINGMAYNRKETHEFLNLQLKKLMKNCIM